MNYFDFFKWNLQRIKRSYKGLRREYRLESSFHPSVTIDKNVMISNRKNLHLGKDVHISAGSILDCGGSKWCDYKGSITLGDHVYISFNAVLLGAGELEIQKGVKIGNQVLISTYTPSGKQLAKKPELFYSSIPPHEFNKVTIEERAVIGPQTIIVMGVTIGHDAVIAPGCIIRHNVAPHTFVFPNTKLHKKTYPEKR